MGARQQMLTGELEAQNRGSNEIICVDGLFSYGFVEGPCKLHSLAL